MKFVQKVYNYCLRIPNHFYPFSEELGGKRVRGQAAYDLALAREQQKYGYGAYGAKLIAYRSIFHIIGAVLFIFFSVLLSRDLVGSDGAIYLLFFFAAAGILYGELYVQPRILGQKTFHAFVDWFSWIVPMVIYMYAHTHGIDLRYVLEAVADMFT